MFSSSSTIRAEWPASVVAQSAYIRAKF
jgi:hypothetical protein